MTKILWEVPTLDHDLMMKELFNQSVLPRGRLERRVVWNLLNQLSDAGFSSFILDDGEEKTACSTIKEVMELAFNLDDCYVYTTHKDGGRTHWIRLVFGNDGWDSVCDYGSPENDADGFRRLMDAFDGEDYV